MVAVRENEHRAQMIGYNTFVYKLIAMMLAGVMAALAGALNAIWNLNANPTMLSTGTTINALVMTIIGGAGTLVGPVLGAGVLQLMGYFLNIWFGPRWPLIFGIVFILIVLFIPYGLVGTWRLRGTMWKQQWRGQLARVRRLASG
jgi:branched-chain amino acid transport system permease protein